MTVYKNDNKLINRTIRLSAKYELNYVLAFIKILRTFRKSAIDFIEKYSKKTDIAYPLTKYSYKITKKGKMNIYYSSQKVHQIDDVSELTAKEQKKLFEETIKNLRHGNE